MNEKEIRFQLTAIEKKIDTGCCSGDLYNDAGVGYYLIGEFEKAKTYLKKAVKENRNPSYHFNLANTYSQLNQVDLAIDTYLQVLEIDPNHIGSLNNLADEYERNGEIEKAHELFHYIILLQPDNAISHFNLGNFFLRQNQHIESAKCYERALEIDDSLTDAYYNIALILFKAKAFDESVKYIRKGLQTDNYHADLLELKNRIQNLR